MKSPLSLFTAFMLMVLCCSQVNAGLDDEGTEKTFGPYKVLYSTFNSQFLQPDIASQYQLLRAEDQSYINISVIRLSDNTPVNVDIKATASNLMQQTKNLSFKKIEERGAVYFLGGLRHTQEDLYHLDFILLPEGASEPITFRLTRTFYKGQP